MGDTQQKPSSNDIQENQQDQQDMNAFFVCEICTEQVPLHQKFKNEQKLTKPKQKDKKRSSFASPSSSAPCAHPFCTSCIAKYIQVKVEESWNRDIKCPGTNCVNVLDPLSCCSFLPPEVFVRWYDQYLCRSAVYARYDTAYYCPNPNSSELVSSDCKQRFGRQHWTRCLTRSEQEKSNSPRCKLLFCLRCMALCQDNHQCSRNDSARISRRVKQAVNEVLFILMVTRKKWKRCPNCKHYVEKIKGGCLHITCRCKYEFCYGCGVRWSRSHPEYRCPGRDNWCCR